ncbi:hypothetical protein [Anaeromicrobium sediminis]|uniref:Uncharacterized protein n=1 Tax=Anaeromicrobium sediminis TaxID=1478221 RepID=A0A267MNF3_9FIRM|nr:hypothetical protein [Anaeromicrobium sediminis]PAB61066.1 hypothetical protein CCE28_01160 [Anaeromicrobium sediminis]
MSKTYEELATEITKAWLEAIGSCAGGDTSSPALKALDLLNNTEKINEFYKEIHKTISTTK